METYSESRSSSLPFRSKKKLFDLQSDPIHLHAPIHDLSTKPFHKEKEDIKQQEQQQFPWSSKMPEKPIQLRRRSNNRGFTLSVSEVKKIAQHLCKTSGKEGDSPIKKEVKGVGEKSKRRGKCSNVAKSKSKLVEKLPQKYEMLMEFFNCMESSIRLLRLKGSMTTFKNICPKIEILTSRRFTYGHLAQLKHILPEAIGIKKILSHDESTLCMKPDLQVTLQADANADGNIGKSRNGSLILREVFHTRLLDFYKAHPEGDDIPEETLPEPFNQTKIRMRTSMTDTSSPPVGSSSRIFSEKPLDVSSHLPPSFQRRFSEKTLILESEKAQVDWSTSIPDLMNSMLQSNSSEEENTKSVASSYVNCSSKKQISENITSSEEPKTFLSPPSLVQSCPLSPLVYKEKNNAAKNKLSPPTEVAAMESTPVKLISTPARLMTITPELQTPKRFRLSPDDDFAEPGTRTTRIPTRSRSLNFSSPIKTDNVGSNMATGSSSIHDSGKSETRRQTDEDIIRFLPASLLQSVREKERKEMEDLERGLSGAKRRQQMIASLPKLFNMVRLIFQSANRSVVTKQELLHKIISSHSDIVDRSEVEEQLELLQELLPEWICGKMGSSGDFLFRINKMAKPESIHAKLAEAE